MFERALRVLRILGTLVVGILILKFELGKRASDVEQLGGGHDLDPDDFKNFLEQQSGLKGIGANSKPASPTKNVSSLNPRP